MTFTVVVILESTDPSEQSAIKTRVSGASSKALDSGPLPGLTKPTATRRGGSRPVDDKEEAAEQVREDDADRHGGGIATTR